MHPTGGQAAATACQPNKALESLDIPLRASSLRYWCYQLTQWRKSVSLCRSRQVVEPYHRNTADPEVSWCITEP